MDKVTIIPCYFCKGRIAVIPPCDTCEGHGRLKITYSTDICGELTQRIEPQPDAALPATPKLDQMNARKAATQERRQRRLASGGGQSAAPTHPDSASTAGEPH